MKLTLAFLATTALAAPPAYDGVAVCKATTCTYAYGGGGTTTVSTLRSSGEHYHCEKSGAGCVCHCHVAFKCTLRHHHTSGYKKSLHHCAAGATSAPTSMPTPYPTPQPCPTIATTEAAVDGLVSKYNDGYRTVTTYDFSRGAGSTLHYAGSTLAMNSGNCATTASGLSWCSYSKQSSDSYAHLEFSIPSGSSIKCNLLHNEDDIIYKSGTNAKYNLVMATDGGNNCANTGTNKPCVKIYNNGASTDFINAWQAFTVQCIENDVTVPARSASGTTCTSKTANALTAVNAVAAQAKVTKKVDFYSFSRGAGNILNFGGKTLTVNSNTCTSGSYGNFCTYSKQSGDTNAHFEFSLPAGSSIKCNLLHEEDDIVYKSGTNAKYNLVMATDGGNNCANTGTNQPCVKIYNTGAATDFINAWQAYTVQCVGSTIGDYTVAASGNYATDESNVKTAVTSITSALATSKKYTLYDFSRGAGNLLNFGGKTLTVNSNSCTSGSYGNFCTYSKQSGDANAHFEFSLPAGSSIKCNLLHEEDDIVYKSGTNAKYNLVMATDGGNNCANTGTNQPCVKIYNTGAATDFINAWQAYTVQCVGSTIGDYTVAASGNYATDESNVKTAVTSITSALATSKKYTLYDFSRGASNLLNFGGKTLTVNSNSCTSGSYGNFCTYSKQSGDANAHFEFSLPAGSSIKCQLLHNEDDIIYKSGTAAKYDLVMVTDGGNNCANTGTSQPCVKIYNNGAATDFIHAWQAYAVSCMA